jgi:hypothetical protein
VLLKGCHVIGDGMERRGQRKLTRPIADGSVKRDADYTDVEEGIWFCEALDVFEVREGVYA